MTRASTQKRLPAFGREILELRRKGMVPAVQRNGHACTRFFVTLDTWDYGKDYARVVVTPEHDPAALDFSFVAGLDVELMWLPRATSLARRDATIRALVRANPQRLMLWTVGTGEPVTRATWIISKGFGLELAEYA